MTDNYIQLKDDESILRLKIKDSTGKDTGNYLEFDLQDMELPMTYQKILEEDKKARLKMQNEFSIIDKRQDHKGKKLFSANEEAKIKAMQEFYKKEIEIYNMFLGENGVQKLLNGRKIGWSTLEEIDRIIETAILPKLEINAEDIKKKIMEKYSAKKGDVIE